MSSDMDVSEDEGVVIDIPQPQLRREQTVDYLQVAAEYRRNNWNTPSQPFHKCFQASTKQETHQAYVNAFQPRSGGFKSLFVDTTEKEKEKEEIVVLKKSETQHLSPTSKAKLLWENF